MVYLICFWCFIFNQFNLIIVLVRIEFIFVVNYIILIILFNFIGRFVFILLILIIRVFERLVGLIIILNIIRLYGNDYLLNKLILQC